MGWLDEYEKAQNGRTDYNERSQAIVQRDNIPAQKEYSVKPLSPEYVAEMKRQQQIAKSGEIRQHEPQGWLDKTIDVATNPMTAFEYASKSQRIPDNFAAGPRNPFDYAIDVINPFQYALDTKNLVEGAATGDLSQIGEGALGVLPLGLEAKNISRGLKKLKKTPEFKSEIDWGKWNKEIPSNKKLVNEYNSIEEISKANNSWMKNPDGSIFTGDPELFIQSQSDAWVNAYGSKGMDSVNEVYRGVGPANNNPDFSKGFKEGDKAIFTADKTLAKNYEWGVLDIVKKNKDNFLTPNSNQNSSGIYKLGFPKGKQINYNAMGDDWSGVNLAKGNNKINLEWQLNKQKEHLNKLLDTGLNEDGIAFSQERIEMLKNYINNFDNMGNDSVAFNEMRKNIGDVVSTDDIASYIENTDLNNVTLNNIVDGGLGNVTIVNNKKGNYLKSLKGNNGNWDLNNPNIHKALVPAAIGTASLLSDKNEDRWLDKFEHGGVIKDDEGYWNPNNHGKVVEINSNDITMRGVNQPLIGISDTGDTKMMYPGEDYKFKGNKVTEYPMAQKGKTIKLDEKSKTGKNNKLIINPIYKKAKNGASVKNKKKSTNFTTPNWLDKYTAS